MDHFLNICSTEASAFLQDKIQNLDKLYSLYVNVIQTIQGYGDVLWTDVVSNIEDMTAAVNSFQARAKTLPKALRDWPAYKDCRCACICCRRHLGEPQLHGR